MKQSLLAASVVASFSDVWIPPEDKSQEAWNENMKGGGLPKFPGLKVRLA